MPGRASPAEAHPESRTPAASRTPSRLRCGPDPVAACDRLGTPSAPNFEPPPPGWRTAPCTDRSRLPILLPRRLASELLRRRRLGLSLWICWIWILGRQLFLWVTWVEEAQRVSLAPSWQSEAAQAEQVVSASARTGPGSPRTRRMPAGPATPETSLSFLQASLLKKSRSDDRVKSSAAQWMAAQQAPRRQTQAFDCSVLLHRRHGVFRTTGDEAAGRRQQRRQVVLVAVKHSEDYPLH